MKRLPLFVLTSLLCVACIVRPIVASNQSRASKQATDSGIFTALQNQLKEILNDKQQQQQLSDILNDNQKDNSEKVQAIVGLITPLIKDDNTSVNTLEKIKTALEGLKNLNKTTKKAIKAALKQCEEALKKKKEGLMSTAAGRTALCKRAKEKITYQAGRQENEKITKEQINDAQQVYDDTGKEIDALKCNSNDKEALNTARENLEKAIEAAELVLADVKKFRALRKQHADMHEKAIQNDSLKKSYKSGGIDHQTFINKYDTWKQALKKFKEKIKAKTEPAFNELKNELKVFQDAIAGFVATEQFTSENVSKALLAITKCSDHLLAYYACSHNAVSNSAKERKEENRNNAEKAYKEALEFLENKKKNINNVSADKILAALKDDCLDPILKRSNKQEVQEAQEAYNAADQGQRWSTSGLIFKDKQDSSSIDYYYYDNSTEPIFKETFHPFSTEKPFTVLTITSSKSDSITEDTVIYLWAKCLTSNMKTSKTYDYNNSSYTVQINNFHSTRGVKITNYANDHYYFIDFAKDNIENCIGVGKLPAKMHVKKPNFKDSYNQANTGEESVSCKAKLTKSRDELTINLTDVCLPTNAKECKARVLLVPQGYSEKPKNFLIPSYIFDTSTRKRFNIKQSKKVKSIEKQEGENAIEVVKNPLENILYAFLTNLWEPKNSNIAHTYSVDRFNTTEKKTRYHMYLMLKYTKDGNTIYIQKKIEDSSDKKEQYKDGFIFDDV